MSHQASVAAHAISGRTEPVLRLLPPLPLDLLRLAALPSWRGAVGAKGLGVTIHKQYIHSKFCDERGLGAGKPAGGVIAAIPLGELARGNLGK